MIRTFVQAFDADYYCWRFGPGTKFPEGDFCLRSTMRVLEPAGPSMESLLHEVADGRMMEITDLCLDEGL